MIPLKDNAPRYSTPFVTVGLIIVNVLLFFYQLSLDPYTLNEFIARYGVVPLRFAYWVTGRASAEDALLPFFTSMFLHGGWLHVIGNMWFLWIFGDNIEDQLGHLRYLLFYIACGLAAGFAQTFITIAFTSQAQMLVPSIGASGAIAGVMGAYLLLFPGARVLTLVPFFLIFTVQIPAWVMLVYWILIAQVVPALVGLGAPTASSSLGGVAVWAHIGGFFIGMVLVKLMGRRRYLRRYYEW